MGYSCYVHIGPMILVPDMRVPGDDISEMGLKCPTHGDKKSGEGEFCMLCGSKKIEYAKNSKIARQCYDEVDQFLQEFGGEDKFFETYLNVTTEFLGRKYIKHEHLYICEEECESIEVHPNINDGFGHYDSFVSDIHNSSKIRHLQSVLTNFNIPHEFKIGVLVYRM